MLLVFKIFKMEPKPASPLATPLTVPISAPMRSSKQYLKVNATAGKSLPARWFYSKIRRSAPALSLVSSWVSSSDKR